MTDRGLRSLSQCKKLDVLSLHGASITDAGLECLNDLEHLDQLSLIDCPNLTGDGIARLTELPHLWVVGLSSELVTPESVARLNQIAMDQVMGGGRLDVYGTISDPELRRTLELEWGLYEQPEMSEEEFWRTRRELHYLSR